MSIEALAMAGVNCAECGINLEPSDELELQPPPLYLVAEEKYLSFEDNKKATDINKLLINGELIKERIREWAKANRPETPIPATKQQCLSRLKLRGRANHLLHGRIIVGKSKDTLW
ncbi:hypothetical protein Fot_25569 [Forsythia ovata]|uniref:Uncharacterized protein n=1 Tax=Forsythia ovata TaxID=205694 RepID=A0ABD1U9K2_9LAMI